MNISDHEFSDIALTERAADTSLSPVGSEPETPRAATSLEDDRTPRSPRGAISDWELTFVLVSTDFLCACIALPLSLLLFSQLSTVSLNSIHRLGTNFSVDSIFPPCVIVALALGGLYRSTSRRLQPSAFMEIRDLAFGVGGGCVLALAIGALLHAMLMITEPDATQLVLTVLVTVVAITFGRLVMRFFLYALTTTRVLVVGSGKLTERIMTNVRQDPGMTLVGRVVDSETVDDEADGTVRDLPVLCRQLRVDRVLIAFPEKVSDESLDTFRQLQNLVHIAMVPRYFELISWRSRMSDLSGTPFIDFARSHLSSWDSFMKRAFDITISSVVLIVVSPLLLAVAIGVKLSSPGPVFFHQTRMGRHQQPFTITKFRSMRLLTEAGQEEEPQKRGEEPQAIDMHRPLYELRGKLGEKDRITRFGAFLRKTSIDEIPQFINVFRGDMSIVGPRPFIPEESGIDGWGTRRYDVRPGITGLWQVSGRNDLSRQDLLQLDYLYVASWSMWWDLKIMWETPKTMAKGTGAY